MTQRDGIKQEIDKVREENLPVLLKIVQALEQPVSPAPPRQKLEWQAFIEETYGSLRDAPIERGPQGEFEQREPYE